MPKQYSGLRSIGAANDSDYESRGGKGLLGSRAFNDIEEAEDFFGVKYSGWDNYDDDNSSGAFKDWWHSATQDEKDAAIKYTGSAYTTINKYLRGGNLDEAPDWVKDTVKNIDSGMSKFNLKDAITVWRGGSNKLIGGATTVADVEKMRGAIVIDRGVTSSAVTKDQAWTGGAKMGYEIVYPKGRGRGIFIDPVSENHGEQEFMARRGTRYEVLGGYTDADGRVWCRLKAVYGKRKK